MYRSTSFSQLPLVVKNLLIINGLFFLAKITLPREIIDMEKLFALHPFQSPDFEPYQIITHMFMHGDFTHLFFNMFAIWMFGKVLENVWGGKRFLIYYIITGLGAMILYSSVQQVQISVLEAEMSTEQIEFLSSEEGYNALQEVIELMKDPNYISANIALNQWSYKHNIDQKSLELLPFYHTKVLGASGALFGILLAFGMLFPNTLLYLFFAIPLKAKYFVIGYGVLELVLTFTNTNDGVAHLAHLGGMLFGFIAIRYWKRNRNTFY